MSINYLFTTRKKTREIFIFDNAESHHLIIKPFLSFFFYPFLLYIYLCILCAKSRFIYLSNDQLKLFVYAEQQIDYEGLEKNCEVHSHRFLCDDYCHRHLIRLSNHIRSSMLAKATNHTEIKRIKSDPLCL